MVTSIPRLCLLVLAAVTGCNDPELTDSKPIAPETRQAVAGNSKRAGMDAPSTSLSFANVTKDTGIQFSYHSGAESNQYSILESLGGGVGCFDFDRDGSPDLVFTGGGTIEEGSIRSRPNSLWRGTSKLEFTEVTEWAGLRDVRFYSHAPITADYDNDGFCDVLVTGYGGVTLFQNQGDGTFRSVSLEAGLRDSLWSSSAGRADLNGDGCLDLYVCHYVNWSFDNHPFCRSPRPGQRDVCPPKKFDPLPHSLFYSNGDGTFHDASREAGLRMDGKGLGVILNDLDGDGDVDIYVANDTTDNFLYLNDGQGHFEEVGWLRGVAFDQHGRANGSMGVDVGDYNLDGLPDIWVTNFEMEANALYTNVGGGHFQHSSDLMGISSLGGLFVGFGTAFFDGDLDGDEDLIVTNGHVIKFPASGRVEQTAIVLMNEDGKRYTRVNFPQDSFFQELHRGRGLVADDLDNDGDRDVVISHNDESVAVLRNDSSRMGDFLQVTCIGSESNRNAIGTHLELVLSTGRIHRWIHGGGSYESQSDYRVSWGIPRGASIQELQITWPNGQQQALDKLETNQALTVIQP